MHCCSSHHWVSHTVPKKRLELLISIPLAILAVIASLS